MAEVLKVTKILPNVTSIRIKKSNTISGGSLDEKIARTQREHSFEGTIAKKPDVRPLGKSEKNG